MLKCEAVLVFGNYCDAFFLQSACELSLDFKYSYYCDTSVSPQQLNRRPHYVYSMDVTAIHSDTLGLIRASVRIVGSTLVWGI